MKKKLRDIIVSVSWLDITRKYMDMRVRTFYDKLDHREGLDFTEEEAKMLKNALFDLSERIRRCAEKV